MWNLLHQVGENAVWRHRVWQPWGCGVVVAVPGALEGAVDGHGVLLRHHRPHGLACLHRVGGYGGLPRQLQCKSQFWIRILELGLARDYEEGDKVSVDGLVYR